MVRHENNQESIVDIDSFNLFLEGYLSDVLRNSRQGKTYIRKIEAAKTRRERMGLQEIVDPEFDVTRVGQRFPIRTHFPFSWEGIPWEDIPQSIREVISLPYESASLPEEKKVGLAIYDGHISFGLSSPSIVFDGMIDKYGEEVVGAGVALQLIDEYDLDGIDKEARKKGKWYYVKGLSPRVLIDLLSQKSDTVPGSKEHDELLKKSLEFVNDFKKSKREISASEIQLRDIALFLEGHREPTKVGY